MYRCPLCLEDIKELDELKKHIHRKHSMHETSEEVILYLKAMEIRDEEQPIKKVEPEVKKKVVKKKKVKKK